MTDELWEYKGKYYNVIVGPLVSENDDETVYTTIYECDQEGEILDLKKFSRAKGSNAKQLLKKMTSNTESKPKPKVESTPEKEPKPEPESEKEESESESDSDEGCIIS